MKFIHFVCRLKNDVNELLLVNQLGHHTIGILPKPRLESFILIAD